MWFSFITLKFKGPLNSLTRFSGLTVFESDVMRSSGQARSSAQQDAVPSAARAAVGFNAERNFEGP